jgi:hypothetical protein
MEQAVRSYVQDMIMIERRNLSDDIRKYPDLFNYFWSKIMSFRLFYNVLFVLAFGSFMYIAPFAPESPADALASIVVGFGLVGLYIATAVKADAVVWVREHNATLMRRLHTAEAVTSTRQPPDAIEAASIALAKARELSVSTDEVDHEDLAVVRKFASRMLCTKPVQTAQSIKGEYHV